MDQREEDSINLSEKVNRIELEGKNDAIKYLDRIHDNLMNYNNMLIAGFFALTQLQSSVPKWLIAVPVLNLLLILWINYRQMQQNRIAATFSSHHVSVLAANNKYISITNFFSKLSLLYTLVVTVMFFFYLYE